VSRQRKTVEDYRYMALTCATAVQRHRLRAQRVTGTQHQQELILQATYLYFTAAGEADPITSTSPSGHSNRAACYINAFSIMP